MNILTTPNMERCIGCYSCSLACARLVHRNLSWLTGFQPEQVRIPKRFHDVTTWKGQTDSGYLETLTRTYARRLVKIARKPVATTAEGSS